MALRRNKQNPSKSSLKYPHNRTATTTTNNNRKALRSFILQKWKFLKLVMTIITISILFYQTTSSILLSISSHHQNDITNQCDIPFQASPQHLATLTSLNLQNCNLQTLPSSITTHALNLQHLDISNNPSLTTLPSSLINLKQLEVLFASNNPGITTLPSVLGKMTSLTRLGWKSGSLTSVPYNSIPPNIVHLILTNNAITELNDERIFSRLIKVRKLMLSHNAITSLSEKGVAKMKNLELIRLSGNDLSSIPDTLWTLPKLSWLTLSGNPKLNLPTLKSQVPMISLSSSSLTFSKKDKTSFLGQGASGKVVRATYKGQDVAVKRIHSVTSDGRPEDELKSYGALTPDSIKKHMVGALALFHNDQDKEESGIIMKVLPTTVVDLALPPTIVEVTTDRWDSNESFSTSFIRNVLQDIAQALHYLHYDIKIVHGDVYAHNIKVDKTSGRAYLLDLGASYAPLKKDRIKAEKLEVRAFGVLMDELLNRHDGNENDGKGTKVMEALSVLRDSCLEEDVSKRPSFEDIKLKLSALG